MPIPAQSRPGRFPGSLLRSSLRIAIRNASSQARRAYRANSSEAHQIHGPEDGLGTELLKLVKSLGIAHPGCGCKSVAARMNSLGVEGFWRERESLGPNFVEVVDSILRLPQRPPWLSVPPLPDGHDPETIKIHSAIHRAASEQLLCHLAWLAERDKVQRGEPVTVPPSRRCWV